jgi:hypothetical protein
MANFYAVAEVIHRYPADAEEIAVIYPELLKDGLLSMEQDKRKALENCVVMPRVSSGKLGDKVIYQKVIEGFKQFAIKPEIFNFSIGSGMEVRGGFRRGGERLIRLDGMPTVCACIDVAGQCNIIFYEFQRFIECQGEFYAAFRYNGETGFFSLGTMEEAANSEAACLMCAYMYRGLVEPTKVSLQEYKEWPAQERF